MKLRTALREDGYQERAFVDYIGIGEVEHDAMAAHALLQAMDEFNSFSVRQAKQRAAEILAGWLGEE